MTRIRHPMKLSIFDDLFMLAAAVLALAPCSLLAASRSVARAADLRGVESVDSELNPSAKFRRESTQSEPNSP